MRIEASDVQYSENEEYGGSRTKKDKATKQSMLDLERSDASSLRNKKGSISPVMSKKGNQSLDQGRRLSKNYTMNLESDYCQTKPITDIIEEENDDEYPGTKGKKKRILKFSSVDKDEGTETKKSSVGKGTKIKKKNNRDLPINLTGGLALYDGKTELIPGTIVMESKVFESHATHQSSNEKVNSRVLDPIDEVSPKRNQKGKSSFAFDERAKILRKKKEGGKLAIDTPRSVYSKKVKTLPLDSYSRRDLQKGTLIRANSNASELDDSDLEYHAKLANSVRMSVEEELKKNQIIDNFEHRINIELGQWDRHEKSKLTSTHSIPKQIGINENSRDPQNPYGELSRITKRSEESLKDDLIMKTDDHQEDREESPVIKRTRSISEKKKPKLIKYGIKSPYKNDLSIDQIPEGTKHPFLKGVVDYSPRRKPADIRIAEKFAKDPQQRIFEQLKKIGRTLKNKASQENGMVHERLYEQGLQSHVMRLHKERAMKELAQDQWIPPQQHQNNGVLCK